MKSQITLLAIVATFLWACNGASNEQNDPTAPADTTTTAAVVDTPATGNFGAEISPENAIPVTNLLATLGEQDSMQVKVAGTVNEVCQMKGCWMTMDLGNGEEMMVKFKDYAFFVPKNCSGKEAIMKGVVKRTVVPVEELKHYAQDAGKSEEEIAMITEPEEQVTFLAEGVIIR